MHMHTFWIGLALTLSASVVDTWVLVLSPHRDPNISRHRFASAIEGITACAVWAGVLTGQL